MSNEVKEMKVSEGDRKEELKSLEIKVPKPNLKELRKSEQFMKTIYDQQYVDNGKNLTQVAQYLQELTDTLVSGKTIGNDFKNFGWELRPPRKKPKALPIRDIDKVELSGLKNWEEKLFVIQSLESFYKMRKWNAIAGAGRVVPTEVLDVIEGIVLEGLGLKKVREHGEELAKRDKEILELKERIRQLDATINSLTSAFDRAKSTQTYLGKNPLSKSL